MHPSNVQYLQAISKIISFAPIIDAITEIVIGLCDFHWDSLNANEVYRLA